MTTTNNPRSSSYFITLSTLPSDGPFALEAAFRADKDERKVNMGIGVYSDDNGRPWRLASVTEAKKQLNLVTCDHEYLPPQGSEEFLKLSRSVLFGDKLLRQVNDAVTSIQTISGTGANSLIARFLGQHLRPSTVWLPDPTWENHLRIWRQNAPGVEQRLYPYFNPSKRSFDVEGMIQLIEKDARPTDVILLHACAHNPTGLDPKEDQWQKIASVCQEKQLFVVFDCAYQGFASGDLDYDAWAVRYFLACPSIELAVCQSFSKNLGIYGERVGALHFAVSRTSSPAHSIQAVLTQLIDLQRGDISTPALFGTRVAVQVMKNSKLRAPWADDLIVMSGRIKSMRKALYDRLVKLGTPGDWHHIVEQTGMFSYMGLTKEQVDVLKSHYHIYMLDSGRASICGLSSQNVGYVAHAIHSTVMQNTTCHET